MKATRRASYKAQLLREVDLGGRLPSRCVQTLSGCGAADYYLKALFALRRLYRGPLVRAQWQGRALEARLVKHGQAETAAQEVIGLDEIDLSATRRPDQV